MNVNELHKLLGEYIEGGFGDYIVIVSKDSEGNGYSALSEVTEPNQMVKYDYEYEFTYDDSEYDDEEIINVIVLYP